MKKISYKLCVLAFFIAGFTFTTKAQYASIQNTNMQIIGVVDSNKVAFATNTYLVRLNKETGEFKITINVDELTLSETTETFQPDTTLNEGKELIIRGKIPLKEVLDKRISQFDVQVPVEVEFNDTYNETYFVFNVFLMANQGFNIIGRGAIKHQDLYIENLEKFEEELVVNLNFVGY